MDTIPIRSWAEFRQFAIDSPKDYETFWRGQMDPHWPLASSFERLVVSAYGDRLKSLSGERRYNFLDHLEDRYLNAFKEAASGRRGPNPKKLEDDEWWALGRHYGLITPLLDWTEKPYIATFFALSDLFAQMNKYQGIVFSGKSVAIYRLINAPNLGGNGLKILKPTVDELGRLQNQRSVFTWIDSIDYFDLQEFLENTERGNLLTKIVLSEEAVVEGLNDLREHGIDYQLLFPDLTGAALHANTKWFPEDSSVYKLYTVPKK